MVDPRIFSQGGRVLTYPKAPNTTCCDDVRSGLLHYHRLTHVLMFTEKSRATPDAERRRVLMDLEVDGILFTVRYLRRYTFRFLAVSRL